MYMLEIKGSCKQNKFTDLLIKLTCSTIKKHLKYIYCPSSLQNCFEMLLTEHLCI